MTFQKPKSKQNIQKRKNIKMRTSDPLVQSVKKSARSARAQGSAVTNSLFSFSFFKLALTGGVVLGFTALFFISGVFGDTKINLTLTSNPDLKNGLILHYTFDGSDLINNVTDISGSGNNGYLTNFTSTTTVRGKIGQALDLAGSNEYVTVDSNITIPTTDFTYSIWAYEEASISHQLFMASDGSGGNEFSFIIGTGNIDVVINGVSIIDEAGSPAQNQWNHHVATRSGSDVAYYLNGVETQTGSDATSMDFSTCDLYVGLDVDSGCSGTPGNYFTGKLDDARVYNRGLSAAEVTRLYQLGATTHLNTTINTNPDLENGLIGHWTFDGADLLQNVVDRSGSGNTGYLTNFTSTTTTIGRIGQALDFDGTDDYINVTGTASLNTGNITVSTWVNWQGDSADTDANGRLTLIQANNPADDVWFNLNTSGNSKFNVYFADLASPGYHSSNATISQNTWTHLVANWDGSSINLYIDGALDKSVSTSGSVILDSSSFKIGSREDLTLSPDFYFNGLVDDTRVYNRALSAEDVARLYQLGATTHVNTSINTNPDLENGLVGHWSFDGGDITSDQILDRSGQGNHAGFFGGATSTAATIGRIGQALDFDGTDDYVAASTFNSSIFPATFTAWVKISTADLGACDGLMFSRGTSVSGINISACDASTKLGYHWNDAADTYGWTGGPTVPNDEWFLTALVVESGKATMYAYASSGQNSTVNAVTHSASTIDDLRFGVDEFAGSRSFKGQLDDVRVYNRALSTAEVQRLYDLGR